MKEKILKSRVASFAILLIGAIMIFYGLSTGEAKVVLEKAIRICMECIGIE